MVHFLCILIGWILIAIYFCGQPFICYALHKLVIRDILFYISFVMFLSFCVKFLLTLFSMSYYLFAYSAVVNVISHFPGFCVHYFSLSRILRSLFLLSSLHGKRYFHVQGLLQHMFKIFICYIECLCCP